MSLIPVTPRRRVTAVAAALLTAGTMTLTLAQTTTATAAAPKVTGYSLNASQAAVRTTTGKKVRVSVDAYRSSGGTSLSIGASNASESHYWSFPIAPKHFTLNKAKRTGKLAPAAVKVSPFAKVALAVKPIGKPKTQRCQGQAVGMTQRVSVTGKFWLDTKSGKRWGKIGSTTKKFAFRTSALASWSYAHTANCGGPSYAPACVNSVSWNAYSPKVNYYGEGRKVFANRYVKLSRPKGASRSDSRTVIGSTTFTQNSADDTATLVVKGNGKTLTGSATLKGQGKYVGEPSACGKKGKKIQYTSWSMTSYTNGPKALRTTDIFGAMTVPNNAAGSAYLSKGVVVG